MDEESPIAPMIGPSIAPSITPSIAPSIAGLHRGPTHCDSHRKGIGKGAERAQSAVDLQVRGGDE